VSVSTVALELETLRFVSIPSVLFGCLRQAILL